MTSSHKQTYCAGANVVRACVRACVCVSSFLRAFYRYSFYRIHNTICTNLWTQIHRGHPPQNGLGLTRHITTTASTDSSGALVSSQYITLPEILRNTITTANSLSHIYQRRNVFYSVAPHCTKSFLSVENYTHCTLVSKRFMK